MFPIRTRPGVFLFSLILILMTANLASAAPEGQVVFEGSYGANSLQWDADAKGQSLPVVNGTRTLTEPGLPALPVDDLLLMMPAGTRVASAWIEPLATHLVKLKGPLAVSGDHVVDSGEFHSVNRLAEVDGQFPAVWGEFGGNHVWRGNQLLAVTVYPVRKVMVNGEAALEVLDDYAVRVEYDTAPPVSDVVLRERLVPGERTRNVRTLQQLVRNPEVVESQVRSVGQTVESQSDGFNPSKTPSLTGSPVDYLIITNEAMKTEFQRLADFKTASGIRTVVTTVEYIETNFRNGADLQETVRMFIIDAYQKWGIEYVMLGGDTDVLPARYVDNSFYPANGSTMIPADLYFACLDGTWNANEDYSYGDPESSGGDGDDVDFAEEVYLGRATVSSAAAAAVFVDKVMTYETTAAGASWPNRALYAAEVLFWTTPEETEIVMDGAQFSDQMVTDLLTQCTDMEYLRMHETDELFPRDLPLTRTSLIDTLNTGHYGIFNQIGHGFYFVMSVGDANFTTTDADNLTNGDNLFLMFSLNCASAAFDYSCLMERLLQNPNGGSVASVGSSRAAFPNTSNGYQQHFFDNLYCGTENRVGNLIALSRMPFLAQTIYNYVDRWTFENYTLLGDPTLPLWTGVPQALAVTHEALNVGDNMIQVHVEGDGALPVENAIVTLNRDGESFATGTTNASGDVFLNYLATGTGDVSLTVRGDNLARQDLSIPVGSGGAYLSKYSVALIDDGTDGTLGNGNGIMEAGETVGLHLTIAETGGGSASGLSGVLSTTAPGVYINTPLVTFPDIGPGGFATADVPVLVNYGINRPDATPVEFTLTVIDDMAQPYNSKFTMVIKAPEFEVVSLDWDDAAYGNGDKVLDNGERVDLTVRVKNFGAGTANSLTATLRTDNFNVVLFDTLATFGALALQDESEASNTFSLQLTDTFRNSTSWILLEDDYGRTYRHDFYLQRPMAPTTMDADSSEGADIIALSWLPAIGTDIKGYNVYRSTGANGPWTKANKDLIDGTSYFRDTGLDLLTRYYYQVESVDSALVPSPRSITIIQATAPAELEGFPVAFSVETSGHLAIGDVDGNGTDEVVLASDEVYVWHHDGNELMDGDGDSQTLGLMTDVSANFQPAGIAMAQLDDQPGYEMVVSDRGNGTQIYVYTRDGSILPGWPQNLAGPTGTDWNWATPAVGDIDGDGAPEIVVNTVNGLTWAWHADGTEVRDGDANPATNGIFYVRPGAEWEWSRCSPALCDLDGDGAKDIIFGTKNGTLGWRLIALKYDGSDVPGFPYIASGGVDNSPAVADLNGDGVMEIVFYDFNKNLHVVQEDGTSYPGFPVNFNIGSNMTPAPSVALGNLDEDPDLEIMWVANRTGDLSTLMAVDTDIDGGLSGVMMSGWPVDVPGSSEGSPVLGDIDGDGAVDVLYGIGGGSEDAPNNLYAIDQDGNAIEGFPITLNGPLMPSPVICDLDHDGDVDIVYGGWDMVVHVWDMPSAYDRMNVPWPTFRGNMRRDGVFFPLELVDVEDAPDVPASFLMNPPYPNPFNPTTSIKLYVAGQGTSADLDLVIYDIQGRKVRTLHSGPVSVGWHTLVWDGKDGSGRTQSSGLYFAKARSGQVSSTYKLTLVK